MMNGTVSERRVGDISGAGGARFITLLEKKRVLNGPDCIKIDYTRVPKEPQCINRDNHLQRLTEGEVLTLIQKRIYTKFQNPRKCFVRMLRIGVEKVAHAKPSAQRVAVHEMAAYLKELDIALDADVLVPIFSKYEHKAGEGIDFATFADMLSNEPPEVAFRRADGTAEALATMRGKPVSQSTASHVLMRTDATVPQNQYASYDQTVPLYGCSNGLDINNDGSNNGFFVAPSGWAS